MIGVNEEFDLGISKEAALAEEKKIRIMIDEDPQLKNRNYETVSVNGRVTQIKRGVPVYVSPEVVHVLENAVTTYIEQRIDPATGQLYDVEKNVSAIPWRRV